LESDYASGGRRAAPAGRCRSNARRVRPDIEEVAGCVAALEAAGQRATGDVLAARFGVSGRTGRRLLTDVRSLRASPATG